MYKTFLFQQGESQTEIHFHGAVRPTLLLQTVQQQGVDVFILFNNSVLV